MRQFKVTDRFTNREGGLHRYLNEVSSIKMISPDEEYEIAVKAASGDQSAINTLVKVNLRFVISVAKMYASGRNNMLEDLINEGNQGLIEAAHSYDPSTGFKFISYAVWHVRKNMLKYLTDHSRTVKIPQNQVNFLTKSAELESDLSQKLGRDLTQDEIIEAYIEYFKKNRGTDLKKEYLKVALESGQRASQLDPKRESDDDPSPIQYIDGSDVKSDSKALEDSTRSFLIRCIKRLNSQDQTIIMMRHGLGGTDPYSFSDIGIEIGKTSEAVRQRYKKAMRKLKLMIIKSGLSVNDLII
jgi:RNA polymerase primary sigma factor